MGRKIAKKETIKDLVREVLKRRLVVESQEELCELVLMELRKEDEGYSLSPARVRDVALELSEITVKAKTRRAAGIEKPERCPVCGGKISEVKTKNLRGEEIAVGYKCESCGFRSGLEAFAPRKYVFLWKGGRKAKNEVE